MHICRLATPKETEEQRKCVKGPKPEKGVVNTGCQQSVYTRVHTQKAHKLELALGKGATLYRILLHKHFNFKIIKPDSLPATQTPLGKPLNCSGTLPDNDMQLKRPVQQRRRRAFV